ncbi:MULTISPECIES: TadE/TadG family type IV pilus assembly protein [Oxalobacteraceae]|uniref:TadE/TadG family type IV pilus assembly protein n=1 Tax=Herminiimonas sp. Marseille-P9896 TaxID=2742211 RepID=UPI00158BE54C|nr:MULTISPECIES: TadE/TadG family type IV pilus assembly protein [Oxalobacteraceae]
MRKNVLCLERKQKGAAAIEFAFVFPVFFLVFYGIITYGIIFLAQQSITLAAAEGARAALRFSATETVRDTNARNAAIGTGSAAAWLGTRISFDGALLANCPFGSAGIRCYRVTVTYPNYRQNPLVPYIVGNVMSIVVPERLTSTAIVQLD